MPFGVQIIRCPKCRQPVYHAEEVLAAGKKWHKLCFKCGQFSELIQTLMSGLASVDVGLCKKILESTTLAEHGADLYCKQCYVRKFVRLLCEWMLLERCVNCIQGPKGVGFGVGAGTLVTDTGEHLGNRSGSDMP